MNCNELCKYTSCSSQQFYSSFFSKVFQNLINMTFVSITVCAMQFIVKVSKLVNYENNKKG